MASDGGSASLPSGTGSKSINMGVSMTGMTWCRVTLKSPFYKDFIGYSYGTGAYQNSYSAPNEALNTTKFFRIKDTSGAIVYEGTHTGFSGNNLVFNITTNTISPSMPAAFFEWGN